MLIKYFIVFLKLVEAQVRSDCTQNVSTIEFECCRIWHGKSGSTNGDVYSYGILLLEIFTGKSPTSDMFTEGLDLHNFVKMALPDQILQVLDPLFLVGGVQEGEETAEENIKKGQIRESLIAILKIGVACSVESPRERMDISDVVNNLQKVKSTLLRCGIN